MSNNLQRTILAATVIVTALAGVACGQKGALYLPRAEGEIVTRPARTPDTGERSAPKPAEQPPAQDDNIDQAIPATPSRPR